MSWKCACGIENGDGRGNCSNCGWTRQKAEEYIRKHPPGSEEPTYEPPPPLMPGMKEYKVVSLDEGSSWFGDSFSSQSLENALNSIAREGWSMKAVINTRKSASYTDQKMFMVFERTLTEEMLAARKS